MIPEVLLNRGVKSICGRCGKASENVTTYPGGCQCVECSEEIRAAQNAMVASFNSRVHADPMVAMGRTAAQTPEEADESLRQMFPRIFGPAKKKAPSPPPVEEEGPGTETSLPPVAPVKMEPMPEPEAEGPIFAGPMKSLEEFKSKQKPAPKAPETPGAKKDLPKLDVMKGLPKDLLKHISPEEARGIPEVSPDMASALKMAHEHAAYVDAFTEAAAGLNRETKKAIEAAAESRGVPGVERSLGEVSAKIMEAQKAAGYGKFKVSTWENRLIAIDKLMRKAPPTEQDVIKAFAQRIRERGQEVLAAELESEGGNILEELRKSMPETLVEKLISFPRPENLLEPTRLTETGPVRKAPRKKKEGALSEMFRHFAILHDFFAVPPVDPRSERTAQLKGIWQKLKGWASDLWTSVTGYVSEIDEIDGLISELEAYVNEVVEA
jgi:hypothetical protein